MSGSRAGMALIAGLSLAAVGAAVYTQHAWNMQPCPWCVLQRVIFVAIAVLSLLGLLRPLRGAASALMLMLALCGMAAALWQHFVAADSASCNLTLADRIVSSLRLDVAWPEVFMATASCADAKVSLFGLPYEAWSLGLFVLVAALTVQALRPARPYR